MARFWLKVVKGQGAGTAIPVDKKDTYIGTDDRVDLQVDDDKASRVHSRIRLEGGAAVIQNNGTRNPTKLNNQPIMAKVLKPGDRIKVGGTVLEFTDAVTASKPPYKWVVLGALAFLIFGLVGLVAYRRSQIDFSAPESDLNVAANVPGFTGALKTKKIAKNPMLEKKRKEAREHLFHGDSLRVSGDLTRAMQQYNSAVTKDPQCDLCKRRHAETREQVIERAQEYERAGLIAYEAGRYHEAAERFHAGALLFHQVDPLWEQRLRKRETEARHAHSEFAKAQ